MAVTDDVLEAARAGDEQALEAVLREYQPRAYRFAWRMCRNPDDAEDVAQETLLAMARGLRGFRGASSVSTWLFAIARSTCRKARDRKRRRQAEVALADAPAAQEAKDPRRSPQDEVEARRQAEALDAAIRALAPAYREILVLRDVEGLSAAEVAEVTGLTVEAVKSRLHRARASVRARLAPLFGTGAARAGAGCPDIGRTFSRYLEGEIGPVQCAEMERHLLACRHCTEGCEALKRTLGACRVLRDAPVPPRVAAAVRRAVEELVASNDAGGSATSRSAGDRGR